MLFQISVVGDTLSDSGQINNQQIIVPECRLHEDIGSLLLSQTLTDVTLVVLASPINPTYPPIDPSPTPPPLPPTDTKSEDTPSEAITGCQDTNENADDAPVENPEEPTLPSQDTSSVVSEDDNSPEINQTVDRDNEESVSSGLHKSESNEAVRKLPQSVSYSAFSAAHQRQKKTDSSCVGATGDQQKQRQAASSSSTIVQTQLSSEERFIFNEGMFHLPRCANVVL